MNVLTRPQDLPAALRTIDTLHQIVASLLTLDHGHSVRGVLPADKSALAEVLLSGFVACDPRVEARRVALLAQVEDLTDDLLALHAGIGVDPVEVTA